MVGGFLVQTRAGTERLQLVVGGVEGLLRGDHLGIAQGDSQRVRDLSGLRLDRGQRRPGGGELFLRGRDRRCVPGGLRHPQSLLRRQQRRSRLGIGPVRGHRVGNSESLFHVR